MTEECKFCKYFMPSAVETDTGDCTKNPGHRAPSDYCSGFEPKSQYISVDISSAEDNKHFKASYPAETNSDIIASTSAACAADVLGSAVQQSYQERLLDEVEKIKKGKVKKGLEIMGRVNLGIFQAHIKKSWEW